MGMYDSFYIDIECPYCHCITKIECQTKELFLELRRWEKGDSINTTQYNYLDCIADCRSLECKAWENKEIGYVSGFGRSFEVRIKLKEGIVTGEYEILEEGGEDGETDN